MVDLLDANHTVTGSKAWLHKPRSAWLWGGRESRTHSPNKFAMLFASLSLTGRALMRNPTVAV